MPADQNLLVGLARQLRAHEILRSKVMAREIQKLAIARMIEGFDPSDQLAERWIVLRNVLHKFSLRIGRSRNQHRMRAGHCRGRAMKEILILSRVPIELAL